jgi:adenylosuccinate synthase
VAFRERLTAVLAEKQAHAGPESLLHTLDAATLFREQMEHFAQIKGFLVDASEVVNRLIAEGRRILFEGAQGTLLDVDLGTYPYVTSSSATAGGACTGTGVGPTHIDGVVGVMKAYATRVGEGPFPTELTDATGDILRERGQEYGATTGRPRRCGWLDAVALRYAVRVNGLSTLALTKLDVLDTLPRIRVCTAYQYRGGWLTAFPTETGILAECTPAYEDLPGWEASTIGALTLEQLPKTCRAYLDRLQELARVDISLISTGPRRDQTILVETPASREWGLRR